MICLALLIRKYEFKTIFITFYHFWNIDISVTMRDFELKCLVCALKIALEGSVSHFLQIWGLVFILCQKTGNFCTFA